MSEEYKKDRKWSDSIIYDESKLEFVRLLNRSNIFGHVDNIEPANEEDDNVYNIDTYINGTPIQVRLQRVNNKKSKIYNPTIRYSRPGEKTEYFKMRIAYDHYIKTGENKMPIYLLWGMIDEKNKIVELKLINLHELFEDRKNNLNINENYKVINDSEKFSYKENNDGTSFVIIITDKYTRYHYKRS